MRAGWKGNTILQGLTRVADRLGGAFAFAELIAAELEDLRQSTPQWESADSTTGFDLTSEPGAVRLEATVGTQVERTTSTTYKTNLADRIYGTAFSCAQFLMSGTEPNDIEIMDVRCRLDPVRDGVPANKEVAYFELWLYVAQFIESSEGGGPTETLVPICNPNRIIATGTAPDDFTFDYTNFAQRPKPKAFGAQGNLYPILYLVVRPLKSDGSIAGNVGWAFDEAVATVVDGTGNVLSGASLNDSGFDREHYVVQSTASVPRMRIRTPTSYSAADLEFTGANLIDLGATPTGTVEFTIEGETPGGSTLLGQVRNDADSAWVDFTDGSVTEDSDDAPADRPRLAGVTKTGTWKVRARFGPGTGNRVSPTLQRLGARALTSYVLSEECRFDASGTSVDPVSYQGEIGDLRVQVNRGGEADWQDPITRILSQNHIGRLELRMWWGHTDTDICPRSNWMPLPSFDVVDYKATGSRITLVCRSPLARLKRDIPLIDPVTNQQELLSYAAPSAAIYEDLLDIIGVPDRYRGQGLSAAALAVYMVAKEISDSTAKAELDALAGICGGVPIDPQGRFAFLDLYGDKAIDAIIPKELIRWGEVGPGYAERVPIYRVPFGWDRATEEWAGWYRAYHTDALAKLDRAPLADEQLGSEIARWFRGYVSIISIVRVGSTVTVVTAVPHGFIPGESVGLFGAVETDYNEIWVIDTTPDTVTFTFDIGTLTPTSPATPDTPKTLQVVSALPEIVADRMVTAIGAGLIILPFHVIHPFPELHNGSLVACEIEELVMRDVATDQPIFGPHWVLGLIVAEDPDEAYENKDFSLWIRRPSDIIPSTAAGERLGFDLGARAKVYRTIDQAMLEGGDVIAWDGEAFASPGMHPTAVRIYPPRRGPYVLTLRLQWDTGAGAGDVTIVRVAGGVETPLIQHNFDGGAIPASGEITLTTTSEVVVGDYFMVKVTLDIPGTNTLHVKGGDESRSSFTVTPVVP